MRTDISLLIADDNPAMLTTLRDILEEEGVHVMTAASGMEAIAICRKNRFDVILLDVRMPDINGVETYRRIKEISEGTRVIMMSAFSVEELKREALKEGAIAFLQKPVDVEKLLKIVNEAEHPPVLLVMDDEKERERLFTRLSKESYRIYLSESAEEALELARQIRFNLIMIDTRLHTMNGLELYLALKKITPTSITILFAETEDASLKQAEEAVRQCAYTFLEKPLDIDKLLLILSTIKKQQNSNLLEKPEGANANGERIR